MPTPMTFNRNALELLRPGEKRRFSASKPSSTAPTRCTSAARLSARAPTPGNTVNDIERLASFAHRYNARVLVALNTIPKGR